MSVHEQFAEDLGLYALGSLEGEERAALETHLEECASCRRELEVQRGDLAVLALTASGPQPPVRARQRLMSAIARGTTLAGCGGESCACAAFVVGNFRLGGCGRDGRAGHRTAAPEFGAGR